MLIIRRIELCQYIIWYIAPCWWLPGLPVRKELLQKFLPDRPTRQSPTQSDIPDAVLTQFDSPDDEHCVARNMWRREINKYIEKTASSWLLTRIKHSGNLLCHGSEPKYLAVTLSVYVTFQIVKYIRSAKACGVSNYIIFRKRSYITLLLPLLSRMSTHRAEYRIFYALVETGGRQKVLG